MPPLSWLLNLRPQLNRIEWHKCARARPPALAFSIPPITWFITIIYSIIQPRDGPPLSNHQSNRRTSGHSESWLGDFAVPNHKTMNDDSKWIKLIIINNLIYQFLFLFICLFPGLLDKNLYEYWKIHFLVSTEVKLFRKLNYQNEKINKRGLHDDGH